MSSNSHKKRINEFVIVVKTNSFVCFLGEFEDTKCPFEIIWPLLNKKCYCLQLYGSHQNWPVKLNIFWDVGRFFSVVSHCRWLGGKIQFFHNFFQESQNNLHTFLNLRHLYIWLNPTYYPFCRCLSTQCSAQRNHLDLKSLATQLSWLLTRSSDVGTLKMDLVWHHISLLVSIVYLLRQL